MIDTVYNWIITHGQVPLMLWAMLAGAAFCGLITEIVSRKARPISSGEKRLMFEMLGDLVEYAADERWEELAAGAEFTLIDRHMAYELHRRAKAAARIGAMIVQER